MNKKAIHKKVHSKGVSLQQTQVRIAPIPSPEDMEKYKQIHPDFPERILKMAELERMDRNKREDKKLELEIRLINAFLRYKKCLLLFLVLLFSFF